MAAGVEVEVEEVEEVEVMCGDLESSLLARQGLNDLVLAFKLPALLPKLPVLLIKSLPLSPNDLALLLKLLVFFLNDLVLVLKRLSHLLH